MPRLCTICTHPQHSAIDQAILEHIGGYHDIARRFGVTHDAVFRHKVYHLGAQLAQAGVLEVQALAERVRQLDAHVEAVLDEASDPRTRLLAVAEARRNVDSLLHLKMVHDQEQLQQAASVVEEPQLPPVPTDVQSTREVLKMLLEAGGSVPPRELEAPRDKPKDDTDPPPFAEAV